MLAEPMALRSIVPRLLAALLTLTWAALALALLVSAGEGQPGHVVLAIGATVPALAAAAAVAWPPAGAGRAGWVAGWLGVAALLLAVPFALYVGGSVADRAAQFVVPSAALAYAGLAAVLATTVYGALGWWSGRCFAAGRHGPRGSGQAALIGFMLTTLLGATAGGALATNGVSLAGVPGTCVFSLAGSAQLTITAQADIDGITLATAAVEGERSGTDQRWSGSVAGEKVAERAWSYVSVGGHAQLNETGGAWQPVAGVDGLPAGQLDQRLGTVLDALDRPPTEDLGIDLVDGAPARHCRISIDGPRALRAFLPLGWLLGREPLDARPGLGVWRGDLDWWTFADGHLGRATARVAGHPADAWGRRGLQGTLRAELRATERGTPRQIEQSQQ